MQDLPALVFSMAVATAVVAAMEGDVAAGAASGAWQHGRAQAGAEARRAKEAILGSAKAKLRERLEQGSKSSPASSAWWWAWAGLRTAKAVRKAMRGARKGAENALAGNSGPFRRVFAAVVEGARRGASRARTARPGGRTWFARAAKRATRNTTGRAKGATAPEMGVCDRCGVTAARTALDWDETDGVRRLLCAGCRLAAVTAPAATAPPRSGTSTQPHSPDPEGAPPMARELVAATSPGNSVAPASQRLSGEVHTHGDFMRQTAYLHEIVARLPVFVEAIKSNLTAADASRQQLQDMTEWMAAVEAYGQRIKHAAATVDTRQGPVVKAVTDAGGPCAVASAAYMAEM